NTNPIAKEATIIENASSASIFYSPSRRELEFILTILNLSIIRVAYVPVFNDSEIPAIPLWALEGDKILHGSVRRGNYRSGNG
ncbi:MAG: hypothetical protein QXF92_02985, partial [Thermosphaera sp.]